MLDDIAEAVLAREEVVKYLRDYPARERIHEYLDELRTTQRYPIYRALQHPLYPIRRKVRDPAYLVTLKAYVAELLKKHDLFFYPEGGRSYSGELKPAKTGLVNAALAANHPDLVIVPTAVAYDLVLEDHILARQGVKKQQRPFSRELAEMVRYAVGYRSRAFVTFGAPIPVADCNAQSSTEVLELTR